MAHRARAVKRDDKTRLLDLLASFLALARTAQTEGDRAKQLSALRSAAKVEMQIALLEHRSAAPEPANYAPEPAPDGTHKCGKCGAPVEIGLVVRFEQPAVQCVTCAAPIVPEPAVLDWERLAAQMREAWQAAPEKFARLLLTLPGLGEMQVPEGVSENEFTSENSGTSEEKNAHNAA